MRPARNNRSPEASKSGSSRTTDLLHSDNCTSSRYHTNCLAYISLRLLFFVVWTIPSSFRCISLEIIFLQEGDQRVNHFNDSRFFGIDGSYFLFQENLSLYGDKLFLCEF